MSIVVKCQASGLGVAVNGKRNSAAWTHLVLPDYIRTRNPNVTTKVLDGPIGYVWNHGGLLSGGTFVNQLC